MQLHAGGSKSAKRLHLSQLHKLLEGADAGEDRAAASVRAEPLHLIVLRAEPLHLIVVHASIINYDSLE